MTALERIARHWSPDLTQAEIARRAGTFQPTVKLYEEMQGIARCPKLSVDDRLEIIRLRRQGKSVNWLSQQFQAHHSTINKILRGAVQ